MYKYFLFIFILSHSLGCTKAQSDMNGVNTDFELSTELVFEAENSLWGMTFLPDGSFLVTSRSGKLFHVFKSGEFEEIQNVPEVVVAGQGGLLDVEIHPDFENQPVIYLSYSVPHPTDDDLQTTAVEKARLDGNKLVNKERIFEARPFRSTTHHYGSRLEFDREGYLYISVGDRGNREELPQSLNNDCGKIHRLRADGSVPDNNPFGNHEEHRSIYSYGHRNPQGMIKHPETGEIWTHEHGPKGGDEINIIRAGNNYGWPLASFGINYDGTEFTENTELPGMESPLHYWVPSIAPSGMCFITSDRYPGWKNQLLVGSLKFQYLHLCLLDGNKVVEEEELLKDIGRLRNVKMGPDGYIYISVESPGRIYRLVPEKT